MSKYEHELKIPYYLLFAPDQQEMTLFHHDGRRYQTVLPDAHGRTAIPDLELEVGLLDNWVRYWFQAKLLPLPGELQTSVDSLTKELRQAKRRVGKEHKERIAAEQKAVQEQQQRLAAEQQALAAEQKAREILEQWQAAEVEITKLRALLGNLPRPPENP